MKTPIKYTAVLSAIFFGISFSASSISHADTIFLKNGQRVKNVETWEENGMIKCRRYGAVIGYPVHVVKEIKKIPVSRQNTPQQGKNGEPIQNPESAPVNENLVLTSENQDGKFRLVKLYDGDSFKATDQNLEIYVRIVGIDTPETAKPEKNKPGQPYAEKAKLFTRNMLGDTRFRIRGYGTDRYKRQLAQVFVNGKDVGLELIRAGLAECYRGKPPKGFDPSLYRLAEKKAKKQRIGIWSLGETYVSPKQWRKRYK